MSVARETNPGLYPFVLTEEQEQLRREIRDFAAREIAPNVMKWKLASFVPLHYIGGDLARCKITNLAAKLFLLLG